MKPSLKLRPLGLSLGRNKFSGGRDGGGGRNGGGGDG